MAEYSFINLEMVAEAAASKEVTVNAAIEALAKGAGSIDVSVAASSLTLTEAQSLSGVVRLTGAPGGSRVVTVDPDISRAILFINATTGGQTIEVEQTGGTNFRIPAGMGVLLLSTTQACTVGFGVPLIQPGGDAAVILRSENSAASFATQVEILHSGANAILRNARGVWQVESATGVAASWIVIGPSGQTAHVGTSIAGAGAQGGFSWTDGSLKWRHYHIQGDANLYLRDEVNAKMQMTSTPAATVLLALTTFHSRVKIQSCAYIGTPTTAPTDADLDNGSMSWWLDEATPAVKARIRKSDGSYLTLTLTNGADPTLA